MLLDGVVIDIIKSLKKDIKDNSKTHMIIDFIKHKQTVNMDGFQTVNTEALAILEDTLIISIDKINQF